MWKKAVTCRSKQGLVEKKKVLDNTDRMLNISYFSNEAVVLITFDFGKIRVRTTIHNDFIQNIEYFARHCFSIAKDFTSETHPKSYVNSIQCFVAMNDRRQVLSVIFKL